MKKDFNLEYQYQLYLKRIAISESQMGKVQKKETRQALMGACGQMLFLLRDEVAALPEDEAIGVLENMKRQVGDYLMKVTNKYN